MSESPTPEGRAVRLKEVPELEKHRDHLQRLSIDDVMIRPVNLGGGEVGCQATVVIDHHHEGGGVHAVPWILGLRPTKEEARLAVATFLRGIVKARREGPPRASRHLRESDLDPGGNASQVPNSHGDGGRVAEASRTVVATTGATTSGKDGSHRRRLVLRSARSNDGLTQAELGRRVGTTKARISQIELGRHALEHDLRTRLAAELGIPAESLTVDQ